MKKLITILTAILITAGVVFAQDYADNSTDNATSPCEQITDFPFKLDNVPCKIEFHSGGYAELWCATEDNQFMLTVLTYKCEDNKLTFGYDFNEVAICFYNEDRWECYEPLQKLTDLEPMQDF